MFKIRRSVMDLLTEKLWNEYFAEECSRLDTNEERELIKKAGKLHELMNETLSIEHRETMEEYIETSYAIQRLFTKKAFFKGCKFAISFLFESEKT